MKNHLLFLFLVASSLTTIEAQTLKKEFNPLLTNTGAVVKEGAAYPDGRLIVWGADLATADGERVPGIVRLLADGSIDHSFSAGTGFHAEHFMELNFEVNDILIQPDEKILVAGSFLFYDGKKACNLVRLNPDGTIDPSFKLQTTPSWLVYDLALQADGKIILSGGVLQIDGKPCGPMARLNIDGSLDTSFDLDESFKVGDIENAKVQSDGKIVVLYSPNSTNVRHLQRFNSDGSVDTS